MDQPNSKSLRSSKSENASKNLQNSGNSKEQTTASALAKLSTEISSMNTDLSAKIDKFKEEILNSQSDIETKLRNEISALKATIAEKDQLISNLSDRIDDLEQ